MILKRHEETPETALGKYAEDLPEEASLTRCSQFSSWTASLLAAPDKGVNCPQNSSRSQQHFCVSSVTIKIPSPNPTQMFSPCLQKKNTSRLFWCKRERPAGPGLMATKRPEGLPSFQHSRLWGFRAMGKHYGASVAKMVNLIKEVTL